MSNPFRKRGVIDSRAVIEYLEELREEYEVCSKEAPHTNTEPGDEDTLAELKHKIEGLEEFVKECEGYCSDWNYGTSLVPIREFKSYVRELVEKVGDLPRKLPEYIVIDWEATADNLMCDYAEVDYLGDTFLIRSF